MTTGEGDRDFRPSLDIARSRVLGFEDVGLDREGDWLRLLGCERPAFGEPVDFGVLEEELDWAENQTNLRGGEMGMVMSA